MGAQVARVCALALAALLASCAAPMQLPRSFVALGDAGEGYRAVTDDDGRLWVRTMFDPTEGDPEFWVGTLKRDFLEERGYELIDEGECRDVHGKSGRWLEMTANVGGERVDYMIAVWIAPRWLLGGNWIQTVEFVAGHEVYERRIAAVRASLSTVR